VPAPPPRPAPPGVTRDEVDLLIRRAGLSLDAGQKADLAVSYQHLVTLAATIPRERPLADEPAFVFHPGPAPRPPPPAVPAPSPKAAKPAAAPVAKPKSAPKPKPKPAAKASTTAKTTAKSGSRPAAKPARAPAKSAKRR
jgi:hypothetical protein